MMSKKLIIESEEVMRILSLHETQKKKIQEQTSTETSKAPVLLKRNRQELIQFFATAKANGCLTDANLGYGDFFRKPGDDKGYIKGPSAKMADKVKRVYDDFTWEVIDPKTGAVLKSGKWVCKGLEPDAPVVDPNADDINREIAAGLWKKRADLVNVSNAELMQLYEKHPKYDLYKLKTATSKQGNYSPEQQAWINTWNNATDDVTGQKNANAYKTTLTDAEKASQSFIEFIVPGSETVFPDGGLKVWYNPNNVKNVTSSVLSTIIQNQTPNREACKKNVADFYTAYDRRESIKLTPKQIFDANKIVQSCADKYSPNKWGILGGGNKLDTYIKLLKGETVSGYKDGPHTTGPGSEFRLK